MIIAVAWSIREKDTRALEKEITYRKELEHLESALVLKKIDQGTYERMKKELQEKYQENERTETPFFENNRMRTILLRTLEPADLP